MKLGTRTSALALAQARLVAELLGDVEVVPVESRTPHTERTSHAARARGTGGDKSRWVKALEEALLAGDIDLAIHSAKDIPEELPAGLELLGTPVRGDAVDVICGASSLVELRTAARVATGSLRRSAQLLAARPDLEIVPIAGNVDTRLAKLRARANDIDALVLARAGLARLGRADAAGGTLDAARFVPAPGQGTLALEGRAGDERARTAAQRITDATTFACLRAERALARALDASCHTPLGAHAVLASPSSLRLRAWAGLPDGSQWVADELTSPLDEPAALGRAMAGRMRAAGAAELLRAADAAANAST